MSERWWFRRNTEKVLRIVRFKGRNAGGVILTASYDGINYGGFDGMLSSNWFRTIKPVDKQ